jgi:hypothetical protein
VDDIVDFFPKMGGPINIPRSDGSFTYGIIVLSNFYDNKYARFASKINKWFIQVYFVSNDEYIYKYIAIDDLIFSNFSQNEIQKINEALNKGVKKQFDFSSISPEFHSINYRNNEFDKLFRKNEVKTNIDPAIFLNLPPLKI